MAKNKKIGQGINALISPESTVDIKQNDILISKISPNPNQPRKIFEHKSLQQLAQSIDEKGLITPITVKNEGNKYIIIAGERRFKAHQLLKRKKIPAYIIQSDSSKDLMYMALIENIQREDLNAIEQAKAYQHLKDNLDTSITEIAKTIGKSRPAVSNTLRLLQLPLEIQDSILAGEINEGQARVILQKNTIQGRITLWKKILREKMSVRKVEASVSKQSKWQRQLEDIENKISRIIGVKVMIKKSKKTGKGYLKIYFDSKTWDRVLDFLGINTYWESDK
tara:strand:+ start:808 stop:1647 length:840 start_codon:yes stop_codon:yes gene_type:complete